MQVLPFIAKFRSLDVDGTGRLGQADLDMGASHPGERKAANNDIATRSLSYGKNLVGGGTSKVAPTSS